MLETIANFFQIACLLGSKCDSYLGLTLDRENKVKMTAKLMTKETLLSKEV